MDYSYISIHVSLVSDASLDLIVGEINRPEDPIFTYFVSTDHYDLSWDTRDLPTMGEFYCESEEQFIQKVAETKLLKLLKGDS